MYDLQPVVWFRMIVFSSKMERVAEWKISIVRANADVLRLSAVRRGLWGVIHKESIRLELHWQCCLLLRSRSGILSFVVYAPFSHFVIPDALPFLHYIIFSGVGSPDFCVYFRRHSKVGLVGPCICHPFQSDDVHNNIIICIANDPINLLRTNLLSERNLGKLSIW